MMATFAIVMSLVLLAMAGLAFGALVGRGPIKGSCGGISCNACTTCPRRKGGA